MIELKFDCCRLFQVDGQMNNFAHTLPFIKKAKNYSLKNLAYQCAHAGFLNKATFKHCAAEI